MLVVALLVCVLLGLKPSYSQAQCTGTAMGVTTLVPDANWLPATVPGSPAPHPWPDTSPPAGGTFGSPITSTCTICPATFAVPICASQYVNMYFCSTNSYNISLCTSAPASNFSLSITTTGNAAIAAGYYGPVFDNDGCGTPNGPAQLTWTPNSSGLYRIRVFQNPCVLNAGLCGMLQITCSIPIPPPNETPCTAIPLAVPIDCTYQPQVLFGPV